MGESQLNIFSPPGDSGPDAVAETPEQNAPAEMRSWAEVLAGERQLPYFEEIMEFVKSERAGGKIVYPKNSEIFNALSMTPFGDVKVVIIGQDPYHGPNQAHGLCFSVQKGVRPPPSLQNIFKELQEDIGFGIPSHGCLEKWTGQGVLLLNAVLTVEARKPGSHAGIGWERFTDRVIEVLSQEREGLVFLLWGSYAQKKGQVIDRMKHTVMLSPHPSPFSANRGFFGCKHFSKANDALEAQGLTPIDWSLD